VRQYSGLLAFLTLASLAVLSAACGESSTSAAPPIPTGSPSARPNAYVWAAGMPNAILKSADGGMSWQLSHHDEALASSALPILMSCAFADETHGWAVSHDGSVLATTDGGETWRSQSTPTPHALLDQVTCVDGTHAWVVGRKDGHAVMLATTDGGATWRRQRAGALSNLRGVAFADADHGWAVGGVESELYAVVLATSDGGRHWREQARYQFTFLSAVTCTDREHAWATGGPSEYPVSSLGTTPPLLLATADGGAHWETQLASDDETDGELRDVTFPTAEQGWAVGQGALLSTADGGATWTAHDIDPEASLSAVSFSDPQHGWITLRHEELLWTVDGGTTWTRMQPLEGQYSMVDVFALGAE
jgi:photosystem II stability/assembly factor-like uncharacterized protein